MNGDTGEKSHLPETGPPTRPAQVNISSRVLRHGGAGEFGTARCCREPVGERQGVGHDVGDGHAGHRVCTVNGPEHKLCEAVLSEVKAHSSSWATVLAAPLYDGPRTQTTLERWHQVHDLLDRGGLLECARRLQLGRNTVSATPAPISPNGYSASPNTGPASSTPPASTWANAGPRTPPSPSSTSSKRSRLAGSLGGDEHPVVRRLVRPARFAVPGHHVGGR
jgi:hypothetical protein